MSEIQEKNDKVGSPRELKIRIMHFIRVNKFALLITLGFFLVMYYVSSVHSLYWTHPDGVFFVRTGEQILAGDGENVSFSGSAAGGPILFAFIDSFIHDALFTVKTISLLSGTGIVFVSYFIMRNFVSHKIALVGQLFVAFNPRLNLLSVTALNELLPIFLIFTSLYYITKKELQLSNVIIVGIILGMSFMLRYQSTIVVIAILIFLLIRNKKIKTNLVFSSVMIISFFAASSPVLIYNYITYGTMTDSNAINYLAELSEYQTPEWHNKMAQLQVEGNQSIIEAIRIDFNLFLKNYVYNLFYYNSSLLFNFNLLNNISIIPIIPYLGFIPIAGSLVYLLKDKLKRKDLIISGLTTLITTFFVLLLGDIQIHFFAIIIVPLLSVCILNIKNFENNLLPLLILGVIFMVIISIVPLYRSYHLFTMWMLIPLLSAIFFVEVVPRTYSKILAIRKVKSGGKDHKIIIVLPIILIILINFGFSYKLAEATFYYSSYDGIVSEFSKLFQKNDLQPSGAETKKIGDILSNQSGIENSYIMGINAIYSYYSNSKFIYTSFTEGPTNDTIDNFITRKNWTPYEIYISDFNSHPTKRSSTETIMPDYLIYTQNIPNPETPWRYVPTPEYLTVLSNPSDPTIPSNFELIYQSNQTNVVVYKINHEK